MYDHFPGNAVDAISQGVDINSVGEVPVLERDAVVAFIELDGLPPDQIAREIIDPEIKPSADTRGHFDFGCIAERIGYVAHLEPGGGKFTNVGSFARSRPLRAYMQEVITRRDKGGIGKADWYRKKRIERSPDGEVVGLDIGGVVGCAIQHHAARSGLGKYTIRRVAHIG